MPVLLGHDLIFYKIFLVLILFSTGCAEDQNSINHAQIKLTADKHAVIIIGLAPAVVHDIGRDTSGGKWQSLIPVYKMPGDTELKNYQPVQPGKYEIRNNVVLYTPDTAFKPGQVYFVRFYKFDAGSRVSDYIMGHNKPGSLHYTDLIFKQ